ncbi:hypothetical protein [Xanthomonas axonopodis]
MGSVLPPAASTDSGGLMRSKPAGKSAAHKQTKSDARAPPNSKPPTGTRGDRNRDTLFRFPISDFRFPISDFRFPISDFRFPIR